MTKLEITWFTLIVMTLLNFFPWHEFSVGQAPDSSASSWMSNATKLKFAWFTYIVMTLKFSKGSLASAVKSLPAETREASGELNISTVSIMISSRSVFLVEYIWGFLKPAESSFYVVEFSMLNGDPSKFCFYSSHRPKKASNTRNYGSKHQRRLRFGMQAIQTALS